MPEVCMYFSKMRPLFRSVLVFFFLIGMLSFAFTTSTGCSKPEPKAEKVIGDSGTNADGGGEVTGEEGSQCAAHDECKTGLICGAEGKCAKPECSEDGECASKGKNLTCDEGACVGAKCTSSNDCPAGQDCEDYPGKGKLCKDIPGGTGVASVRITTSPGVTREGNAVQFKAIALNKAGALLRGKTTFKWTSSQSGTVAIDGSGKATGGSTDGVAQITAEIDGIKSDPANIRNFAKLASGKVRVIITDSKGKAISGAKVMFKFSGGEKNKDSDAKGIVLVDGAAPFDFHIFHKDYAYLSIIQVKKTDLYVQLLSKAAATTAGGVQGKFDFSRLKRLLGYSSDDWDKLNVDVGFAGFSIAGNLFDLSLDSLLGESEIAQLMGKDQALPGGVFLKSPVGTKEDYKAQGESGPRILWALGGRFEVAELMKLIPKDTKNMDVGKILAGAKKLFDKFAFGFDSSITIKAYAKVKDVDGKYGVEGKDDLIPDYGKFPTKTIVLKSKLDQLVTVSVSSYPDIKHKGKSVSLIGLSLAAVLTPGYGLVPLGLMAQEGKGSSPMNLKYASRQGALNTGKFAVVTLALNIPTGEDAPPLFIAGDVQFSSKAPSSISVPAFLGFPTSAKFDPTTRTLTDGAVSGASAHWFDITGKDKKQWIVIFEGQQKVALPKPPAGFDSSEWVSASLRPVKLKGQTIHSILEFNAINIDSLTEHISGFSSYTVLEEKKKTP